MLAIQFQFFSRKSYCFDDFIMTMMIIDDNCKYRYQRYH